MNRTRLSDNFYQYEIFPDGPAPDRLELYLARQLCEHRLEVLREIAGEPLTVRDGRRTYATHDAYELLDYHPSTTSHHAFGPGFLAEPDGARVFPGAWFFAVGAADVKPVRNGRRRNWTVDEFEEAKDKLVHGPDGPQVGQLIYYPVRGHIHISNPLDVLLSAQAIRDLGLPAKRLVYVDPEKP